MKWGFLLLILMVMGFSKPHDLTILVNNLRQKYKAPLITEDERLSCAARMHLDYIVKARSCVYIGPEGQTIGMKVKHCGFQYEYVDVVLFCQVLTLESWFERIYLYRHEFRMFRDHRWKYAGVAGEELWWVLILAR